jgi:phage tail-like protein
VSARGTVDGLASPHPLGRFLPGLYQDDDLVQRFTAGLDELLAPVFGVLDSGDAYVDPWLTPLDFLAWLAQWVGVELDRSWPEARQRAFVAQAADLWAWRGTAHGLRRLVEVTTGCRAEVLETGGAGWTGSPAPAGALPGSVAPALVVRVHVHVRGDVDVDLERLDRLVAGAKPAHVPHRVEVVGGEA